MNHTLRRSFDWLKAAVLFALVVLCVLTWFGVGFVAWVCFQ